MGALDTPEGRRLNFERWLVEGCRPCKFCDAPAIVNMAVRDAHAMDSIRKMWLDPTENPDGWLVLDERNYFLVLDMGMEIPGRRWRKHRCRPKPHRVPGS